MPTGSREGMTMSDMTQWTEAELKKEFASGQDPQEGEAEGDGEGEQREGGVSRTPSTDRRSSSSGSLTPSTSIPSVSDVPPVEEEEEERREGAVADSEGRKRKNSAQALWKSVRRASAELNQDTRRVFRFIGRKLHSRHEPRKTKVKEIHILPGEEEEGMWARRMAGSAHSASSSSSDPST